MSDFLDSPEADGGGALDLNFVRRFVGNLWTFKWLLVAIGVVAIGAAVAHTERQTPQYRASATFLLDPRPPQILGQEIQEVAPIGTSPWDSNRKEYYNAQLYVLRSEMMAQRSVLRSKLFEHSEVVGTSDMSEATREQRIRTATFAVMSSVTIIPPKDDRIIRVVATHTNPKAAALIANAHVDAYLDFNLSLRTEGSEHAAEWLAKELTSAEKDLRDAELDVFKFKKDNELLYVSIEDQRNLVTGNIKRFTDAVNDARIKRIENEQFLGRIREARQDPVLSSALFDLAKSETGSGLKQQYYQAVDNLERLGQVYGPKHPEYVSAKKSADKILGTLTSEADIIVKAAEKEYQSALATEQAFTRELDAHKKLAFELGPKEVDYNRLVRREKSDEERYRVVLDQLRNSEITGRLTTVNVRPMDAAVVPRAPFAPSLRRSLAFAAALALMLGAGLILVITLLDRRIAGPEELESLVKVPMLGVIPKAQDDEAYEPLDLLVHQQPTSSIAEACRNLRTNLLYTGADHQIRTLVVTSPNEREGKTTAAMYLSTVVAQSDKRVLLVESDMRRPRLAKANGVPGRRGLADLILGEIDFDEAIKTTDVPNLFLLPAGAPPPNPSELLMTNRFGEVLGELSERFDMVILDSPPVLAVTDASILARRCDATLLLVKSEQTLRDTAKRAAEQLATVDAKVAGVVLNALDLKKRLYGYYAKYGYGYGYAPVEPAES